MGKSLTGIERLIHMVQQLLVLSRLDAKQEESDKVSINISGLVDEISTDLQQIPDLATTNILVTADSFPCWKFEEAQLRILLRNIMDNAARYAFPESRVLVHIKAKSIAVRNHSAELSVEQLEHLTERFSRATSNKQGSGLGLSICQQICDQNGLTMNISNRTDDMTGIQTTISGFK